jgi:hypothetical protein
VADAKPPGEILQAAALQLISAARQFLDAAEHVVLDPDSVRQAAGDATALARGIIESVLPGLGGGARSHDEPEVEHIELGD